MTSTWDVTAETPPTTIESAIANQVSNLIESGAVQTAIDKAISDAIERAVQDALGFSGEARKLLASMVDESLCSALKASTLPVSNVKLETVLAEIIKQTQAEKHTHMLLNFRGLLDPPVEPHSAIDGKKVFDAYMGYIADVYDCSGREINYDDTPSYIEIPVSFELERIEPKGYCKSTQNAVLHLSCDDVAETDNDPDAVCFDIPLYRFDNVDKDGEWRIHNMPPATFAGIANMNAFEVFIQSLANTDCRIALDYERDDDYVQPNMEPECDWS